MPWGPFRKRRPDPTPPPASPLVEDWAVGDLAECIIGPPWFRGLTLIPADGPEQGDVNKVIEVRRVVFGHDGSLVCLFLGFSRFKDGVYVSTSFRKIIPRADATERADASFIETIAPKVTG
jgi:hypothetical protein